MFNFWTTGARTISERNELPKETVTSQSLSIFLSKLFQVIFLLAVYISFISSFSFYYYLVFFSVLSWRDVLWMLPTNQCLDLDLDMLVVPMIY